MNAQDSLWNTLRARLGVLAFVVLLPLVGLQFAYLLEEFRHAREARLDEARNVARMLRDHVDDHLRNIETLLHIVATAVPVRRDAIEAGNRAMHDLRKGMPDYYGSISMLLPDGTMLYSAESPPPRPGSINVGDRDYFRQALASDKMQISAPIVSRTSGRRIVVMARAVKNPESGETIGVVSASTLLDNFQTLLSGVDLPPGSVVTVINRKGIVIARSRDPELWVGKDISGIAATQKTLQEGEGVAEMVSADGVTRLSAFSSIEGAPWLVYVGIPVETAYARARATLLQYSVATLLAVALALWAAARLSRTITRPLRQLQGDANALANGQLTHRSAVRAGGEIGELVSRFNSMAEMMQRQRSELADAERQYRTTFELAAIGVAQLAPDGRWLRVNARLCHIVGYSREELMKMSFQDITYPDDLDADLALVGQILAGEIDTYEMDKRYRRKDGAVVWINLNVAVVRTATGEPDYFISVIEDIDRRKHAESLLEGQRRVLELIARGAPESESLDTLVRVVESESPEMRCSILALGADGVHVQHRAAPSLPQGFVEAINGTPIGPQAGSCGTAAWRAESVIVEDIASDPLWADYRELAARYGLRACWSSPILSPQGVVLGTFAMYYDRPARPEPRHLRLIEVATHTAAIALSRAREDVALRASETMLRQLSARLADAQEAERRALAAELHDQVGQNLTALNLTFTLLKRELAGPGVADAGRRIDDGIELVVETVARVRDLMVELRPPMLDDYGLLSALRWYAERFAARSTLEVRVTGSEPRPRLAGRIEIALFRIAQEALNNVVKHAGASHVEIVLDTFDGIVQMLVLDDGRGFDTATDTSQAPGWGVAGMRERAAAVGGILQVDSAPGAGTRVTVHMVNT